MLKIYNQYQEFGVNGYYEKYSSKYYNPHQEKIKNIFIKHIKPFIKDKEIYNILDLACGDGLISRFVLDTKCNCNIEGCDPFFVNQYCHYSFSFEDIAKGKLEKYYDLVICSYAFHLIKEEWKYDFLSNLSIQTNCFIIITPSKKIKINHPLWKIEKEIREDKITIIILSRNIKYTEYDYC